MHVIYENIHKRVFCSYMPQCWPNTPACLPTYLNKYGGRDAETYPTWEDIRNSAKDLNSDPTYLDNQGKSHDNLIRHTII